MNSHTQQIHWQEGMFLGAQHFQQADRFHQEQIQQILRSRGGNSFGVLACDIDTQTLAGGDVALLSCEGLFPDGTPFRCTDANEIPLARVIAPHFSANQARLDIWLALPLTPRNAVACAPEGLHEGRHTRYRSAISSVLDSSIGGRTHDVQVAIPNLRLLFGDESRDGHTALHLASLRRAGSGSFTLTDDHVPPCLRVGAYSALSASVRRITEVLIGRSTELAFARRSRSHGMVEFSVSEAAAFLTLHTFNSHLPRLLHTLANGHQHPEEVFLQLATLAAQLMTLTDEGHPRDLPLYTHAQPLVCFTALETRLRELLRIVTPQRYIPIPLNALSERMHGGTLPESALDGARLYLAVVSSLPAERALRDIPQKTKVASHGRLAALTTQALPGIRLTYLATPPQEIPVQPGGTYFELDRASPEWAIALQTRSLAIYLPPELADARAEFLAVKE